MRDPVAVILRELRPVHVSSILLRRAREAAVGMTSVSHERRDATSPLLVAIVGPRERVLTPAQHAALYEAGATTATGLQWIRIAREGALASVPCARCDCWIWIGSVARRAACACGAKYRITFEDEEPVHLPLGLRCMKCGDEQPPTAAESRARPKWRPINEWQAQCAVCHGARSRPWWRERSSLAELG